jgi:dihydrodipicolinate synthase/N-acetylneuraminate lyase
MMIIFIAIDPVELQPFKQNLSITFASLRRSALYSMGNPHHAVFLAGTTVL